MFKLIFIISLLFFPLQLQEKEFYIEKISIVSEYNSRYVMSGFNSLASSERKVSSKTLQCVVANLVDTGILHQISTELIPLEKENTYELVVTPIYKANINDLVVQDIQLDKSFNIDEKLFLKELEKRGIKPGMSFQPYTPIELGIVDVIENKEEKLGKDFNELDDILIKVQVVDSAGIKIDVLKEKPACSTIL